MKKTLTICSLGFAFLLHMPRVQAQQEAFAMNYIQHRLPVPSWNEIPLERSESVSASQVSSKATRDLRRVLGRENRATWYRTEETFMAYFQTGTQKGRSVYDLKGNWRYTLRFFPERDMSATLRTNIKYLYPGYAIKWITEIKRQGEHFFVVTIEDGTTLLNLLSNDDEIEVLQEYNKG